MFRPQPRRPFAGCVCVATVTALVALWIPTALSAAHAAEPSISLGTGQSRITEFDADLRPIRSWTGLKRPVDITPLPDGTTLIVDAALKRVMLLGADGALLWSEGIASDPIRARPRPGGGYLITSADETVVATRPDRTVEWRLPVPHIRTAVPLANGNILAATNDDQGWLTELTPAGEVVWRSRERPKDGNQKDPLYFSSMYSLDVSADGRLFTAVFDGGELRVIDSARQRVEGIIGMPHTSDTRIGPRGELVATSPEAYRVWVHRAAGPPREFTPPMRPISANLSPSDHLFVGMVWDPERAALRASQRPAPPLPPTAPWWQRAVPLPLLATAIALLIGVAFRWHEVRRLLFDRAGLRAQALPAAVPPALRREGRLAAVACVALAAVFAAATYTAWKNKTPIQAGFVLANAVRFLAACAVAGVALRLLDTVAGASPSLSGFVPIRWPGSYRSADRQRTSLLVVLALAAIGVCAWFIVADRAFPAATVALWFAAQVLILAAAFPPRLAAPEDRAPRWVWVSMSLILAAAVFLRFWEIGFYPDFVHHDHVIYGDEVLSTLRGRWIPFFSRIYSVGRPTFIPAVAALEIFGPHYWVLRLPSAVAGVAIVWGTYLLGKALFNERVGVFAAALAMANNVLLLYSRQVYVLDPVAPFVFGLYCAAVGLRRGSRFHWCAAGVLSSWALIGYYASVTFVPVFAAVLLYLAVFYPRRLWANRAGLAWFLAGAVLVYLPMLAEEYNHSATLYRARTILVFLNPDGSINWNPELWKEQLGQSFGSIFFFAETVPWNVGSGQSIGAIYGSILCGIGLAYLLLSWRTPATFLLLAWTVICIGIGSATLPNPPTFYHMMAAVVPLMIASAVPLDRLLALGDRIGLLPARALLWAVALVALGLATTTQVEALWDKLQRVPSPDGRTIYNAGAPVMAARYINEHPEYRYYLVRNSVYNELTSDSALFFFFAADADVSDISRDLATALPVPPVDPAPLAAFIVLPWRQKDAADITEVYPTATREEILAHPTERLWIYLVDAATVRQAYEARRGKSAEASAPAGAS